MQSKVISVGALIIFLWFSGCQEKVGAQEKISSQDFKKVVENLGPTQVIVDIRTPEEVEKGVIKGAIHMDYYDPDFASRLEKLDKDKSYYVYCHVGGRSANAAQAMHEMGFKVVYDLEGGIVGWKELGYSLVSQ